MATRIDLRALRVRMVLLFAAILMAALLAFGGATYLAAVAAEAAEDEPAAEKERELAVVRGRLLVALLAAFPAALATALGGSYWLGRRVFSTLGAVVRTASALSLERLDLRIPRDPSAGRELEDLVDTLNRMLARFEHAATGLRRFTADAAHELRTPLAALASEIEICLRRPRDEARLREVLASTLEGLGRLSLLTESLLALARADAGALAVAPRSCDLRILIEQIAEPYLAVSAERGLSLQIQTDSPLDAHPVWTDPLLLGRALVNLLDNACKFCAPGGKVQVRLGTSTGADGSSAGIAITVMDSGPAPSREEMSRLSERFYRSPLHRGTTPGFGLGLPLCQEYTAALGGAFRLRRTEEGGTEARIWLPLHPGAAP